MVLPWQGRFNCFFVACSLPRIQVPTTAQSYILTIFCPLNYDLFCIICSNCNFHFQMCSQVWEVSNNLQYLIFFLEIYLGSFNDYVDMILPFFDHLPTSTWTFFSLYMDQNWHFLTTHPPTSSCPHSFWTTPKVKMMGTNPDYLLKSFLLS